ncbi:MAG: glycoside hydrolase family 43 protein [Mangrovibacterium sp.]
MKYLFAISFLFFCTFGYFCSKSEPDPEPEPEPAALKVPLGDPFIMLWQGKYYAYGTYSDNGIIVFVSDDLQTWSVPAGVPGGLALKKEDVWADRWFWAPEVYHVNGKFYMYYSADEHICVATSSSPTGPFVQEVQKPMIEGEKCIDNSLFIDDDGKPLTCFFDRFNDGLNIWVAELEENLIDIKPETMHKCINVSQEWEKVWPRVNEGSFVVKHNGVYYMTYSANSYESPFYGVGYATGHGSDRSLDPSMKTIRSFKSPEIWLGWGHSAMFTDKEGKLRIVFPCTQQRYENPSPIHVYQYGEF